MKQFEPVTGHAALLPLDDVNTDQMAPASAPEGADYAELLFQRWRREDPAFILNRPQFATAKILVTQANFGCGSSRESAVWALAAFGIRCVIARSFNDVFRENCLKNGVLPIVLDADIAARFEAEVATVDGSLDYRVDLETQKIVSPQLGEIGFAIAPAERDALLTGADDIALTLANADDIERFEARARRDHPWLQQIGAPL